MDTRTLLTHVTDGGAVYVSDNHKFADASIVVRIDASIGNKDPERIAAEMVKRWNAYPELLAALKDLLGPEADVREGEKCWECRHCGREWSYMMGDNEVPENCPSDDCPGFIARAAIANATNTH